MVTVHTDKCVSAYSKKDDNFASQAIHSKIKILRVLLAQPLHGGSVWHRDGGRAGLDTFICFHHSALDVLLFLGFCCHLVRLLCWLLIGILWNPSLEAAWAIASVSSWHWTMKPTLEICVAR